MKFKFINLLDPYYKEERMLRWEALEKPYGIPPGFKPDLEEKNCIHLIALDDKKLVGCVVCNPLSGKIFDCVIEDAKEGFARKMIQTLEEALQKKGLFDIYVIAQEETQGFFSHLGYSPEGDIFEEYGVPYQRMAKKLLISA